MVASLDPAGMTPHTRSSEPKPGPLAGIRVIDLSNMLMAPYATQILGDMGADVIKVEAPQGDPIRGIGPARHPGMGAIFLNANRSKRSIVLDLKHPAGRMAALDLARGADVLVTNLRPHTMRGLELDYEQVAAVCPQIVYAGLFGYGQEGPYAAKPAFDDLIQGAIGVPWLAHLADGAAPRYTPTAIVDRGVALWAVGEINAALIHRLKGGCGQELRIPMFEMMASFVLGDHLAGHTFDPAMSAPGYARMLNPDRRPYPTRDGYVCVMIYTDKHWRAFFKAVGQERRVDEDPRYHSMATRTEHIADIYEELAALLRTRSTAEWLALLDQADVPAMPLHTLESLLTDPHLTARQFFTVVDHPSEGNLQQMAYPSTWSRTQPSSTRPAPRLGEHSAEVLREIGYDEARIAEMLVAGSTTLPRNP